MEGSNDEVEKEPKPSCCTRARTNFVSCGRFIYNSETGLILGRTGISWLKILSFYIGFYAILAGFWATCLVVFIRTLDPVAPTMQQMFSMMKDNPGMNYEPFLKKNSNTLIKFNHSVPDTIDPYVAQLETVYSDYLNRSKAPHGWPTKDCQVGDGATVGEACHFDMTQIIQSNCTPQNKFGYSDGKPCVLLRINKVFLWQPINATFDSEKCTVKDCEKQDEFNKLRKEVKSEIRPGYISVSCDGENDGDSDNINKVTFYPDGGFPAYFYPYYNQPNYTAPIVMAQFDVVPGRVSMILCKIWTRNVIHDKNDLQGSIHFELLVD